MSENSCSQDLPLYHWDQNDLQNIPVSQAEADVYASLIDSVHVLGYQQGDFPIQSSWSFNSPVAAIGGDPQLSQSILSTIPQGSNTSLNSSSTGSPSPLLDLTSPLSAQCGPLSFDTNWGGKVTVKHASDIKIAPYSMLIPSESYFADSMQHNSAHYIWANRTYQPSQPPPGHLNQHFPQLQPYSPGVFLGHNGHADRSAHSYSQDLPAASPYILLAPVSAERQSPSPSHPMPHSLPFYFAPTHWYNQPLITSSPPYMVDHHAYHIPEAAPIFFPHHASISSQASSMVQDPVYPQQESEPVDSDNGYLVCVLNSRRRPQCWDWDHGCNGREFSSFSNLLRHQRERSGAVTKAECSICGAVFTRKTARNTHIIEGRCPGVGVQMGGQLTMAG